MCIYAFEKSEGTKMVEAKYWNKKIETIPAEELKRYQLEKLREQVKRCYENSAFYKKNLTASG